MQELRRALDFFRKSGKFSIASMSRGGEKEYFLCSACQEFYIPPTANLTLKGFAVGGMQAAARCLIVKCTLLRRRLAHIHVR